MRQQHEQWRGSLKIPIGLATVEEDSEGLTPLCSSGLFGSAPSVALLTLVDALFDEATGFASLAAGVGFLGAVVFFATGLDGAFLAAVVDTLGSAFEVALAVGAGMNLVLPFHGMLDGALPVRALTTLGASI